MIAYRPLYILVLTFVGDKYPIKYLCGPKYTCARLKQKGKCKWNIQWKNAGIPRGCLNKLTNWERNKKVRSFCRRTCAVCKVGTHKHELRKGKVIFEKKALA